MKEKLIYIIGINHRPLKGKKYKLNYFKYTKHVLLKKYNFIKLSTLIYRKTGFIRYFIAQCIEINGVCVWRCTKNTSIQHTLRATQPVHLGV